MRSLRIHLLAALLLGTAHAVTPSALPAQAPPAHERTLPLHVVGSLNVPPFLMGTADFRYIMMPGVRAEVDVGRGFTPWSELNLMHLSGIRCLEFSTGCGGPQTSLGAVVGMNVHVPITTITGGEREHPMAIYGGAGMGWGLLGEGDFLSRRYHVGVDLKAHPTTGVRLELAIVSGGFTAFVPSLGVRYAIR